MLPEYHAMPSSSKTEYLDCSKSHYDQFNGISQVMLLLEPYQLSFNAIALFMQEQIDETALLIMFENNELHMHLKGVLPHKEISAIQLTLFRRFSDSWLL